MIENILHFLQTTPITSPIMLAILISLGFVVGFINTVAGMATAISYAFFMAMGLPINIANGTTRVGVITQFVASSIVYKKKGYLDTKTGWQVGIPVGIGALVGAEFVAILKPALIEVIMGALLPIMAILLFVDTKKITGSPTSKITWWKFIIYIFIGIYGGFTHAGVGLLIMFGSFFMIGVDMLRANAIKQFAVVVYTPIALLVFIIHGQIDWGLALIYAVGNTAGGIAGSYASIKGGDKFIKICVAIIVVIMSSWLIWRNM